MNKIEQLHLDAITQADYNPEDKVPNYVGFASKTSEVSKDLMREFADFLYEEPNFTRWARSKADSQELLDKFLEDYGK